MHPFRSQLRIKTHAHHQRVDDLYSQLNLSERDDYKYFLKSHFIAFSALKSVAWRDAVLQTYIADSRDLLELDLKKLNADVLRLPALTYKPDDCTMGVEYVLAGSHFGQRVLVNRWSSSSDELTLSAGAYLKSTSAQALWKRFIQRLEINAPSDAEKSVIINSACSTFDLFSDSYCHAELLIGRSPIQ